MRPTRAPATATGLARARRSLLNQSGNVITGSAGGTNYFTITIEPGDGRGDVHRSANNLWHSNTGQPTTIRRR